MFSWAHFPLKRSGALLMECRPGAAPKGLDNADIVREAISHEPCRGPRRRFAFYCFTTSMPHLLRSAPTKPQKNVNEPSTVESFWIPGQRAVSVQNRLTARPFGPVIGEAVY